MHGIFFVLLVMSIVFYKERLFADGVYYFFHVVNSGWFHVEHGRIVLGIGQILPVIASQLQIPIQFIAIISSFGHELFYYLLFLFITIKLKNRNLGIAFLLAHLIGQLWLYYTPMYEICYGGALALVFYGLLTSRKIEDDKWKLAMVVCLWFALTSHLENTVVLFYLILFDILERKFIRPLHLPVLMLLFIGVGIEFLTLSSYELSNLKNPFDEDASFLNLLKPDYLWALFKLFLNYYPEILIFNAFSILFLAVKSKWKTLVVFVGANASLLLAINNKANAIDFIRYFESMYYPLVVLCVFTFLFSVYKLLSKQLMLLTGTLLLLCMGLRLVWISSYGIALKERSLQITGLVDQLQLIPDRDKAVINKANIVKSIDLINWALPIEAMVFSSFDGPNESISLITYDQYTYNKKDKGLDSSNFLLREDEIMPLRDLNKKYFSLSKNPYKTVNTAKNTANLDVIGNNLKVQFLSSNLEVTKGDSSYFRVQIENKSELTLPSSLDEKIFLSYHIYDSANDVIVWDGKRTPIQIDVSNEFHQNIIVKSPVKAGAFTIVPDLVVEGKSWMNLKEFSNLNVK